MKVAMISLAVVVLVFIAGGAWWFMANQETTEQTTDNSTSGQPVDEVAEEGEEAEVAAIVTYSDTGFSTSQNTIAAGSTVLVVNDSSETLHFASDPHPEHSDNPELNLPILKPGEQKTMVVEEPGEWGFHNHLNDDHSGFITVTD